MMDLDRFSLACEAFSHPDCEWCVCWCHDDTNSGEASFDELELSLNLDLFGSDDEEDWE